MQYVGRHIYILHICMYTLGFVYRQTCMGLMCVDIYMYMWMNICIHRYVDRHVYMCIHIYFCSMCLCTFIHMCSCMSSYIHAHVFLHVCRKMCGYNMCMYVHICMSACIQTQVCLPIYIHSYIHV